MSVVAAALRELIALGVSGEALIAAIERIEAAALIERAGAKPMRAQDISPQPPEERVWVYVMGEDYPDSPLVKVGISKHPNHRLNTLAREQGRNLYIAHTEGPYSRSMAAEIERNAHALLVAHRERGEWFLCGVDEATARVRDVVMGARA